MELNTCKVLRWIFLFCAGILSVAIYGQDLDKHKWKNRVLVLLANDENSTAFLKQLEAFTDNQAELKERKLILYQVINTSVKYTDFTIPSQVWKKLTNSFHYKLEQGDSFKILLIGLDGGIKLEKAKPVSTDEIFRLIDGMPMRRMELKNK